MSDVSATQAPVVDRRTTPVELLWDLVFVFAVTQVTALLAHHTSWARLGEAMLVLALVWWAWSAFVWAANAQEEESQTLRACLLTGTVLIFVAGLAVPTAFGRNSLLFASTYAAVRFLHLGVYVDASRRGNAGRAAILGFAVTVVIGMVLLLLGAVTHGWARAVLWLAALAIDYAGLVIGATLPLLTAVAMWWTYFDRTADRAQERLRVHDDPVLAAAYSYMHLVIVAGIIFFAGGVKLVVHHSVSAPMADAGRLAMCAGAALYLIGLAAFRWRILGERSTGRLVVAIALMVLYLAGAALPAWAIGALIVALMGALCAAEATLGEAGERAEEVPATVSRAG